MRHHRVGLARELAADGFDPQTSEGFMDAIERVATAGAEPPAQASPRERAMLAYALALTRAPASMCREDLDPMRDAGLDDRTILEVNQVVAYYAYVNRVVDGLGVELEAEHADAEPGEG